MTSLTDTSALQTYATQLPINWYFDPEIYQAELDLLFNPGIQYVGHAHMVPNAGDYHVLDWMKEAKVITHNAHNEIELLSNVCRHRQAIMLKGRGHTENIVCPLHRWTYNLSGELIGAPHFPNKPCLNLKRNKLENWNGLLFAGDRNVAEDLKTLDPEIAAYFNFADYRYHSTVVDHYDINWKAFIEVYLEDYHVVPFHPGLGNFVDCDNLRWQFSDRFSVQTVGYANELRKSGSQVYGNWQETVLNYNSGKLPSKHGAVWFLYLPNIMIEWYPHSLVISSIIPTGVDSCLNVVEFYYPEDILLFEPDFIKAEQAAYMETAVEDRDICDRMQQGRRALFEQGINEVGPYQTPTEDGMLHFHEFMRRELAKKNIK